MQQDNMPFDLDFYSESEFKWYIPCDQDFLRKSQALGWTNDSAVQPSKIAISMGLWPSFWSLQIKLPNPQTENPYDKQQIPMTNSYPLVIHHSTT